VPPITLGHEAVIEANTDAPEAGDPVPLLCEIAEATIERMGVEISSEEPVEMTISPELAEFWTRERMDRAEEEWASSHGNRLELHVDDAFDYGAGGEIPDDIDQFELTEWREE
jgi:hypothetical protein